MDAKASRADQRFPIRNLVIESSMKNKIEEFSKAFKKTLFEFMVFNQCNIFEINQVNEPYLKKLLENER